MEPRGSGGRCGDQLAVPQQGHVRPAATPCRRLDGAAVQNVAPSRLVEVQRRQVPEDRSRGPQVGRREVGQRHSLLDPDRTDRLAPERHEMGADAEPLAEIAGDGAEVRAGTHRRAEGDLVAVEAHRLDAMDGHRHFGKLHGPTLPCQPVAPYPLDVFRGEARRSLPLHPLESRERRPYRRLTQCRRQPDRLEHGAGSIVGIRPDPEAGGSEVRLGLPLDESREPRGPSHQDHQQAGGERIERPCMSHRPDPEDAPYPMHRVV